MFWSKIYVFCRDTAVMVDWVLKANFYFQLYLVENVGECFM